MGLFSRGAGVGRREGVSSEGSVSGSFTPGVERETSRPTRVSRSLETPPVGSEFRLGDGGTGDGTLPGTLRDVVNKLAATCDCCVSNFELLRTSSMISTLRTSGDSGVPGAEGMGLIRVRLELDPFLAYKLAVRWIAGFELPLLSCPLVWAALSGVPGVPTDEEGKGWTPGVPMLAENRGLKA